MERTGFSLQTADFRQFAPNHPEKPAAEVCGVPRLLEKLSAEIERLSASPTLSVEVV